MVAGNYPRPDTDSHMVAQAATPQAKWLPHWRFYERSSSSLNP